MELGGGGAVAVGLEACRKIEPQHIIGPGLILLACGVWESLLNSLRQ